MGHKPEMTPAKAAEYKRLAAAQQEPATKPMSDRQAEAKVKELWGQYGAAWHHAYSRKGDADYCRLGLGVGDVRDLWKPFGRGRTWEEALEDARKRGYC